MGLRAAVGHEFIGQAPRERQVRERSMQVTELPAAQRNSMPPNRC